MPISHFPSLTPPEFHSACQSLHDRCCDGGGGEGSSTLEGTDWDRVYWAQGVLHVVKSYWHSGGGGGQGDGKSEGGGWDAVGKGGPEQDCLVWEEDENEDDEDEQTMRRRFPHRQGSEDDSTVVVDFSFVLSPTYQVPVLWFTFQKLPSLEAGPRGIEAVYRYLMAEGQHGSGIRHVGVMGGISMANHPISDLPAFFVHPCSTADALRELCPAGLELSGEDCLLLWLGLVGAPLNLCVPSKLLRDDGSG